MRRMIVWVALAACGSDTKPVTSPAPAPPINAAVAQGDDCERYFTKSRTVLDRIAKEAGRPIPPDKITAMIAECQRTLLTMSDTQRASMKCVLDAPDEATVNQCWIDAMTDYRNAGLAIEGAVRLRRLGRNAEAYFAAHRAFPKGTVGPTPKAGCCAAPDQTCAPDPAFAKDPVWKLLELEPEASRFQYRYQSDGTQVTATAVGDMDCDGTPITFQLAIKLVDGTPETTLVEPQTRD